MHVGLNLIFLVPGATGGMEIYARELIGAFMHEAPAFKFTAFVNREFATLPNTLPSEVKTIVVPVSASNRLAWVAGEQFLLPRLAKRAGVDLLHSLGGTAPIRGNFRRVITIHDLHCFVVPEAHFGLRAYGMRFLVPAAARSAHRIIVDSENTAADLRHHLRIDRGKIDVVPLGVEARESDRPLNVGEVRERFALGHREVLLTFSAKRPHKNLIRLLQALALIPAERRPVLVLPGYPTPHEVDLKAEASRLGLENDTRFLGWIPPEEMETLFALATVFVFPSLHEGFGLPILEAMARGVPVCCSNRGAMKEAAGDAALTFDPEDVSAIARAMETLLLDRAQQQKLQLAGRERAAMFTWRRTARATLDAYVAAMDQCALGKRKSP